MSNPETGAEILARIKPKLDEDWVEISLRPDLIAELEELTAELAESSLEDAKRPKRNADAPASEWTVILAQQVAAAEQLIEESAVRFAFRALPRDKFRELADNHPPRPLDQYDAIAGYNREALSDALVQASMLEPVFDVDSWLQLVEVVSVGEWNRLRQVAEQVNGSVVTESPKSALASRILSGLASD